MGNGHIEGLFCRDILYFKISFSESNVASAVSYFYNSFFYCFLHPVIHYICKLFLFVSFEVLRELWCTQNDDVFSLKGSFPWRCNMPDDGIRQEVRASHKPLREL